MIKFNNINIRMTEPKGLKTVTFEQKLAAMVKNIKEQAQNYVSDTDFYRAVNVNLPNPDKNLHCKSIALTISAEEGEKAQHLLEVSMLHPSMKIESKRPLAIGKKEDILKYLNSSEFLPQLKQDITEMSEKLASK